ncbi:MAG: hypothetical protein P0Y53_13380 [Candidatus Pseudobacter hemicellulosilyticus]|uniref:Uncharacterized protein n=1 Tax=Candidatus Pseudobacter hemicellulosilyticus TaxID=3121375 RepID=A0AAJ5WMS1_9BACT|nr:MAG: hypothetical protein P0Y53_13380 [Pseudobacter sp.]
MTKTDILHKNRIRRFVKTTIEIRRTPEQLPEAEPARVIPISKEQPIARQKATAITTVKQEMIISQALDPFFTGPIYRAKDFDPL